MSGESICKCGKRIVWAVTPTGAKIPLDPAAPVYEVDPVSPGKCERTKTAMVSHFATCKFASDFSGAKPKAETPIEEWRRKNLT